MTVIANFRSTEGYHDLALDLLDWAETSQYSIQKEERYFILKDGDYCVFYTRTSHNLQCYYVGYGQYQVEKFIYRFSSLKQIVKHIEKSREMKIMEKIP